MRDPDPQTIRRAQGGDRSAFEEDDHPRIESSPRAALFVARGRNVRGDEGVAVPFHRTEGARLGGDGRRLRNFVAEVVPHDHADAQRPLSVGPDGAVLGDDFDSRRSRG